MRAPEAAGMETLRLRRIQQPYRVERLLEALILRGEIVPQEAYQIRDLGTLPTELQRVVARETEEGRVWSCWAHDSHLWLFTCDMSLPLSRERGAPVLQVTLYGDAGEVRDSGTWTTDPQGKWSRCVE
jgi:hypothetical protein